MADPIQAKRWYEVLASLTPLLIGLAVTGVGTYFTAVNNSRQTQLNQITALDKFRPLLTSKDESEREFAYAAFAALGYEAIALKIIQAKQDPAGRALAEEVKQSDSSTANETAAAATVLRTTPARVYIQVSSDAQAARARVLSEVLSRQRFAVQGVENISGKAVAPAAATVRYFNPEDEAAAKAIVVALHEIGEETATIQIVTRFKVRPGSLEVWFKRESK